MVALVAIFILVLRNMPRTKPQEIKADSASAVGWADIAGVEDAREELEEVVEFLRNPERFARLGARVPRGVLLHGPPGTGKTLLAKAVAHESGANFYAQSAAGFVEMFAGLGAARVRRLFRIARKNEPSIIFIDELDAVGGAPRRRLQRREGPDAQPASGRDGRLRLERSARRDRRLEPDRQARHGAAAPRSLRPPDLRGAARRPRAGGDPARPPPRQARRRRRPRAGRPPDLGPDRRRPREHLQRGGDLRRAPRRRRDLRGRLRPGARAPRRGHAVAPRPQRPREGGRRLPRGRPRPLRGAPAGGRPRAPGFDRAARPRARLHAQLPRRGPLPEDARGAGRLHDDAAGWARRGADRLRRGHARAPPTTCAAPPRSPAR